MTNSPPNDQRPSGNNTTCPTCGSLFESETDTTVDWVSILRLADVAEAGYCNDLLRHHTITSKVHQEDDFDVISGAWKHRFLLLVPKDVQEVATDLLKQDLFDLDIVDVAEKIQAEEFANKTGTTSGNDLDSKQRLRHSLQQHFTEQQTRSPWKPLIFVFIAGSVVTMLLVDLISRNREKPNTTSNPPTLQAVLENQSLRTTPEGDRSQRRLSYDKNRDYFILEEDRNNDGIYENQYLFQK